MKGASIGVVNSHFRRFTSVARIPAFKKNPRDLNADFFYVGLLNNVEMSYAFHSAKITPKSLQESVPWKFTSPGYDLRSLPRNSPYHAHKYFPRLTADCPIVSRVGPMDAF